ncbi:DNA polymerase delta, subunit 4-domain-containing protein [Rhodocollybia butyracea]|uniref:DNA polymerase delta, subunit 4-domain-containing protein n=1 Tax=Rhodocollybia butyracea TaxID=206335 RepID=A0A9P5PI91_9AGAR|nr:DNA polymerase delta, subunit 4-domain-containing protein [Rhodocollybia butyracea]
MKKQVQHQPKITTVLKAVEPRRPKKRRFIKKKLASTANPLHAAGPEPHRVPRNQAELRMLQVFDMTSKYGPFIGMTRLERWTRAQSLKLDPPEDVHKILLELELEPEHPWRYCGITGY